jgi:hypothetical protein
VVKKNSLLEKKIMDGTKSMLDSLGLNKKLYEQVKETVLKVSEIKKGFVAENVALEIADLTSDEVNYIFFPVIDSCKGLTEEEKEN